MRWSAFAWRTVCLKGPRKGWPLPARLFTRAILLGHRRAALDVVTGAIELGLPVADVYVEVVETALYEVGRSWEANEITVAEEHMATAIAQYVIAHLYPRIARPAATAGRMVL